MRTTIDVRDDVLRAAREHAARENVSIGELISRWAERGRYAPEIAQSTIARKTKNGFKVVLPHGDEIVSVQHVRKLIEDEGV